MPLPQPLPDLTSLDLLTSVAQLGSIGQAAVAYGVSQPVASTRLRALEGVFGLELLHRPSGGAVDASRPCSRRVVRGGLEQRALCSPRSRPARSAECPDGPFRSAVQETRSVLMWSKGSATLDLVVRVRPFR